MNNKHWLGILLALAGSWLTVGAAQAATTISGNIISPNWTAANSPYIVSENIEVAPGATLTIEAGTVVKFKKNKGITVRGTLKINGNNSNIVVLTSAEATTTRGDWAGITFADESVDAEFDSNGNYIGGSIIKYAVFNHSQGLKLDNSHPYIVNSNFLNNTTAITISGTAPVDTSLNAAVDNHKLLISRNNITNNTIGLIINRAFLAPPMIFDPSGLAANQIKANIVIDGNAINYNQEGIWLQQAQRAAILNNQLNFNNNYGLKISAGAPNAIVQHNTINYNNIGLELAARGANIVKNAIAYNNQAGLNFLNTNNQINNNNIYGNLGYDLRSPLAGGSLANNYWGVATPINASLPTSSSFTIEPRLIEPTDIASLATPTINDFATSTILDKILVSGTKDASADIWINGRQAVALDSEVTWSYSLPLEMGTNDFSLLSKDASGKVSPTVNFTISRLENKFVPVPTINSFKPTTDQTTQALSGSKDINTAIMINGQEAVALDNKTTWQATVVLKYGRNDFTIVAQSAAGYQSDSLAISIQRPDTTGQQVLTAEAQASAGIATDTALTKKMAGRILLQVEAKGEAWYVNPLNGQRYFLAGPANAFNLMRQLGFGVKHSVITAKIVDSKLLGRILIDVDDSGKAYYVHPTTKKLYYLGRPADALQVMRQVGLGINNQNLRKIKLAQ